VLGTCEGKILTFKKVLMFDAFQIIEDKAVSILTHPLLKLHYSQVLLMVDDCKLLSYL
jgi:hypothetical protein